MPRTGRGGGVQSGPHPNRTDLDQPPQVAPEDVDRPGEDPGQQLGGTGSGPTMEDVPQQGQPRGREMGDRMPRPGGMGPVDAPSERPGEPLTAGLESPEQFMQQLPSQKDRFLRALYSRHPNEDLRRLIEKRDMP